MSTETVRQRILVVDDEPQIMRVMRTGLVSHGYDVEVASNGVSALEHFKEQPADLVVTDLSMPNMDGLQLCRKLREISTVPIIVLSVKGAEATKIEALDAGADDYVTKPFSINELLARVRAALRRAAFVPALADANPSLIELGAFRVDLETRSVRVDSREVHLTPKEFDLLVYFLRNAGKVLTHRALLKAIWGGNYVEQSEYLRVFVGQLRKKIETNPSSPKHILTEPWVGYRFEPES
jgi:two-component system, OmpR family, KDP operon response regulator KdpE